jgi:hypothetical protein
MFFLSFESTTLFALPPIHDSEIACHERKAVPTPSLPAAETSRRLVSNRNSIPAVPVSSLAPSRRISPPGFGGPLDTGEILSNRYFVVPDLIGFRFEMPIALWPSIVDESGLESRP